MADLNTVTEDPPAEARNTERRTSITRMTLPRNSILMSSGGANINANSSGNNSAVRSRRQSSRSSIPRLGLDRRFIRYENTYHLEPNDDYKADLIRIRRVATSVIETAISGYKYDPNQGKQFSLTLAERIRSQMKQLPYHRYKIITLVCIGQKRGQDLRVASRCIWDVKWDRHITITKETADAYVTVTIFWIYTE
jgi:hypothetical protein